MKFKKYLQPDTIDKIKELANKGCNLRKISEELNIPEKRLSDITNFFKVEIRKNFTYYINHDFFENINSELKSYILGFLVADGNISCKKGNRQQRISFCNNIDDLEVIELIRDSIIPEFVLKTINKSTDSITRKNTIIFKFSSQQIADDLLRLGVTPNKTQDLQFTILDKIPSHLIRDFIRGFLDGDGCVTKSEIKFVSTSKPFMQEIESIFNELGTTSRLRTDCNKMEYYRLMINLGYESRQKIFDYLYKDSNYYLSRKKAKFF
jgi:intein/homing endonuclease